MSLRLDYLDIEEFAEGEHKGLEIDELDGGSVLVLGGNQTGKTLSFNAILYSLLGPSETIEVSAGRGNDVEVGFTDSSSLFRGQPETVYQRSGTEYRGPEGRDRLADAVGSADVVKNQFVHSHPGKQPLDLIPRTQLAPLIRRVINREIETEIQYFAEAIEHLEYLVGECEDEAERLSNENSELEQQLRDVRRQLKKYEKIVEMAESGELARIKTELEKDQKLDRRLDDLTEEKEALRKDLRTLNRRRRRQENYTQEVEEVIADAVSDFVCPTCDRPVSSKKAQDRLDSNDCPFCGRTHRLSDLRGEIREKIDRSDDVLEELEGQIERKEERRDTLEEKIDEIRDRRPELEKLDGFVKRRLNEYDDVDQLKKEAEEEVGSLRDSTEELESKVEANKEKLEELERRRELYASDLANAEDRLSELKEQSHREDILAFEERWNSVYSRMFPEDGELEITESGVIRLPGRNNLKEYGDGTLSTSEIQVLNFTFSFTLREFAVETGQSNLDVLVWDEPFGNLDSDIRERAGEFLQESEVQVVLFSSDTTLEEHFEMVKELEREPLQTTLGDFQ